MEVMVLGYFGEGKPESFDRARGAPLRRDRGSLLLAAC